MDKDLEIMVIRTEAGGIMEANDHVLDMVALNQRTKEHVGPRSGKVDEELQKKGSEWRSRDISDKPSLNLRTKTRTLN